MKKRLIVITVLIVIVAAALAVFALNGLLSPGDTEKEAPIKLSLGEWSEDGYVNDNVGVSFNPPEDWTYMTRAELAALMGVSLERAEDEETVLKTLARCNIMIANSDKGSSVQIMTEDLVKTEKTELTAMEYIKERTEELSGFYNERNTKNEVGEIYEVKIGRYEYQAVKLTLTDSGMIQFHAARRSGDYIVNVMINVSSEAELEEVVGYFK